MGDLQQTQLGEHANPLVMPDELAQIGINIEHFYMIFPIALRINSTAKYFEPIFIPALLENIDQIRAILDPKNGIKGLNIKFFFQILSHFGKQFETVLKSFLSHAPALRKNIDDGLYTVKNLSSILQTTSRSLPDALNMLLSKEITNTFRKLILKEPNSQYKIKYESQNISSILCKLCANLPYGLQELHNNCERLLKLLNEGIFLNHQISHYLSDSGANLTNILDVFANEVSINKFRILINGHILTTINICRILHQPPEQIIPITQMFLANVGLFKLIVERKIKTSDELVVALDVKGFVPFIKALNDLHEALHLALLQRKRPKMVLKENKLAPTQTDIKTQTLALEHMAVFSKLSSILGKRNEYESDDDSDCDQIRTIRKRLE